MVASSCVAKKATAAAHIRKRLLALEKRVTLLEQALRQASGEAARPRTTAINRERAEEQARHEALMEYYSEQDAAFLGRNPTFLALQQKSEDDRNAFLRSRGLSPEPSRIPETLREAARELAAEMRRGAER
jgi:hypothetical protein